MLCRCIYIANAQTELTLRGVGLSGCEATSSSFNGYYGGAVFLESGATLNAINTTIKESKAVNGQGGAIYSSGSAVVNLYDSHLSTSEANHGGGIFAEWPAKLSIYGSTISSCVAVESGGGIYIEGVTTSSSGITQSILTMAESIVDSGIARTYYGGGLYIARYSKVSLSGTVVSSNIGYRHGAGIYFHGTTSYKDTKFSMADRCVVRNNTIIGGGSDDSFSGTRTYHGAGVWVSSDIIGNISETRFEGNTGATYGGGKHDLSEVSFCIVCSLMYVIDDIFYWFNCACAFANIRHWHFYWCSYHLQGCVLFAQRSQVSRRRSLPM